MTAPAIHRGSSISVVTALLRESILAWFAPTSRDHDPLGGRVETVELWPGSGMALPAAPSGRGGRCQPLASIQVIEVYSTTHGGFPEADTAAACSGATGVTLLVGLWRCGYTLRNDGTRVSGDMLERWTKIGIDDEWRMRRAVCAALSAAAAIPSAAPGAPRSVEGGPVAERFTVGAWTNDETEGGWYGASRECRFLIAGGWV